MFAKLIVLSAAILTASSYALKVGDPAPDFSLKSDAGDTVSLAVRKQKGWTVLFFYPKAGTPGCTKQVCAFRDSIDGIRKLNAEVYGISADTVADQAKFHKEQKLNFSLLADPNSEVISRYGVKMATSALAERWTFIVDPQLRIRFIDDKVNPVTDAKRVAEQLALLQK